ncbi:MAG TPA: dockerin type I domain-containing protein [Tepidisphaeraceae bacterium]
MRKCNRPFRSWTTLFAAASAVALPVLALADSRTTDTPIVQFTPGDYLVMRGGDPANSDASNAPDYNGQVNAYIDEYSQAGYYVGTLALPQMTLPGGNTSSHEGGLNISPNGQWIAFAGYDPVQNPAGTTSHPVDGTANALVGEVNLTTGPSSLNTSTTIPGDTTPFSGNSLTGQYVHSAMTIDGNEFYVGEKYTFTSDGALQTNDTGLLYISGTGASATKTVLEGGTDWRNILIFNGQLYGGAGSSSVGTHGVYSIGTGIPTSNSPIPGHTEITNYPSGQSASSFGFVDIPTSDASAGASNGFNVLYTIGDQGAPGMTKYFYDADTQTWNDDELQVPLNVSNINSPYDVVVAADPTNPSWVDLTVSGQNGIYSYIDKSGDPETALAANAFTLQITPTSNESFFGMTQVPGSANLVWGKSGNGQTWDVGSSSNWTYAGANAKFANQENVTFDDTSNDTQPINLSSVVQPGSITVMASANNYTISGIGSIGGSGAIRLLPGNTSTFTLDTSNTYTGGTIVEGGKLIAGVNNAIPGNTSLTIGTAGAVQLASNTGLATLSSLSIAGNGTLDITNNHLILNYAPGTQAAMDSTIRGYLVNGYAGGSWNGTGGIDSSTAAANVGFGVGYADGADGVVAGLSSGQIEAKYTRYGDANLDGVVSGVDFTILVGNLGKSVIGWDKGDFNYDGVVSGVDFTLLVSNLGKAANGADITLPASDIAAIDAFAAANGLMADVPEPAGVGILSAAAFGLLLRRRAKSNLA